jgi:hypothetical protein
MSIEHHLPRLFSLLAMLRFCSQFAAAGRTGDLSEKETTEHLFRLADVHKQTHSVQSKHT